MKETKFINKEMALMAATTAFLAVIRTGHYANLSGSDACTQFTLDVFLEVEELFTLPTGYVYSQVEEHKYTSPMMDCPPFKNKKYYFKF